MIFWQRIWPFPPCHKKLPESKLKSLGLISLVGEISRQPTIDHVLWSLVIILVWLHNEKEQNEAKKETQNKWFKEGKKQQESVKKEMRRNRVGEWWEPPK